MGKTSTFPVLSTLMAVECMHIPVNTILHFQGAGSQAAIQKIKETYWTILKLNWTVWTVIQYINVNHVPLKVQCLFQSSGMFLYGWVGLVAVSC